MPKLHFAPKQYSGDLAKSGTLYDKRMCLNCGMNSRTFPLECILNIGLRNDGLCGRCGEVGVRFCRRCGGCEECVKPVMEMRGWSENGERTVIFLGCYSKEQGWNGPLIVDKCVGESGEGVQDGVTWGVEECYEDSFDPGLFEDEDGTGRRCEE